MVCGGCWDLWEDQNSSRCLEVSPTSRRTSFMSFFRPTCSVSEPKVISKETERPLFLYAVKHYSVVDYKNLLHPRNLT